MPNRGTTTSSSVHRVVAAIQGPRHAVAVAAHGTRPVWHRTVQPSPTRHGRSEMSRRAQNAALASATIHVGARWDSAASGGSEPLSWGRIVVARRLTFLPAPARPRAWRP